MNELARTVFITAACALVVSCSGGSSGGSPGNPVEPTPPSNPPPDETPSATWTIQESDTDRDILHVQFFDADEGVAVGRGANPEFLRTADGGETWTSEIIEGSPVGDMGTLFGFVNREMGFIGGEACTLARTTDGGENWFMAPICGSERWILTLHLFDESRWWIGGGGGLLFRSTDGNTWTRVNVEGMEDPVSAIAFADANTGFVSAGPFFRTTDGGDTWERQSTNTSGRVSGVVFLDSRTGVGVTSDGTIIRTTNAGTSWTEVLGFTGGGRLSDVEFSDNGFGIAVGSRGRVVVTRDGGLTWSEESSGVDVNLSDVTVVDEDHVWASGHSGTILARDPQ